MAKLCEERMAVYSLPSLTLPALSGFVDAQRIFPAKFLHQPMAIRPVACYNE